MFDNSLIHNLYYFARYHQFRYFIHRMCMRLKAKIHLR